MSAGSNPVRTVAFLGTGIMGAPMAVNLAKAGFEVTAWNRTGAKAAALRGGGVVPAPDPAAAVAGSDAVVTMLTNGAAVDEVLFGTAVLDAARPDTLFIDCSSIEPRRARDHAERLAASGFSHLDAPVSGGESGARAASLAIMAGGEAGDVARAASLFAALGRVTHVGPHGAGQLAKLANQAIVGITIGAVSEALLLAAAGGADPAAVRTAMSGGFATSRVLSEHGERMIERNFTPGGRSSTHLKDMDNILAEATAIGLDLPLCKAIRDAFADLTLRMGKGDFDHSALLLWLEDRNAPHRLAGGRTAMP